MPVGKRAYFMCVNLKRIGELGCMHETAWCWVTRAGSRLGRSTLDCCCTPRKAGGGGGGRGGVPEAKVGQWRSPCLPEVDLPDVSVVLSHWLGSKASWPNGMMNFRSRAWGSWSMTPLVVGKLQGMPPPLFSCNPYSSSWKNKLMLSDSNILLKCEAASTSKHVCTHKSER